MKDSKFIELLNLYVDHQISAEDAARLEAEIQRTPERRRVYRQYCQMQKACTVLADNFRTQIPPAGKVVEFPRPARSPLRAATYGMGVLAAGGDADALARADTYGDSVGLAFQIADDVLDVTGDASSMGKPVGADAAAGRFTFPAVLGLEESKQLAARKVAEAIAAVKTLEPQDGPLAALARYSVEPGRPLLPDLFLD